MLKGTFRIVLAMAFLVMCHWCVNMALAQQFVTDGLISFWSLDKSTIAGDDVKDLVLPE